MNKKLKKKDPQMTAAKTLLKKTKKKTKQLKGFTLSVVKHKAAS